jgi:hypothetical protein
MGANIRDARSRDGDVIARRLWAHRIRREKLGRVGDMPKIIAVKIAAKIGRQCQKTQFCMGGIDFDATARDS